MTVKIGSNRHKPAIFVSVLWHRFSNEPSRFVHNIHPKLNSAGVSSSHDECIHLSSHAWLRKQPFSAFPGFPSFFQEAKHVPLFHLQYRTAVDRIFFKSQKSKLWVMIHNIRENGKNRNMENFFLCREKLFISSGAHVCAHKTHTKTVVRKRKK